MGDERLDIHQTTGNHGYGSGVAVGISAHRLRVVNLLFCSKSLILKVTVSDSLSLLFKKEWPWANRSLQKSDRELFTCDSSESPSKMSDSIEKIHIFLLLFPFFMPKRESLPSLFTQSLFFKDRFALLPLYKSNREQIAPVALYKRASVSDSRRLLMTKEWQERFALVHKRITLSLFRPQNTSNSTENQKSKFTTLHRRDMIITIYSII